MGLNFQFDVFGDMSLSATQPLHAIGPWPVALAPGQEERSVETQEQGMDMSTALVCDKFCWERLNQRHIGVSVQHPALKRFIMRQILLGTTQSEAP